MPVNASATRYEPSLWKTFVTLRGRAACEIRVETELEDIEWKVCFLSGEIVGVKRDGMK